jgi:16S rRNA (guanine527-N7)-methyltransferase
VTPDRIAALLCPFLPTGDPGQRLPVATEGLFDSISTYIDLLLHWNTRINLTAIRDPEEIVTRHFGESLFAAHHLLSPAPWAAKHTELNAESVESGARIRVADVGSGAGFPGVPLKLWKPEISLTLIESNHKKAAFLREVSRSLTLMDINVLNTRAEGLSPSHHSDVVTLRAVERFEKILTAASSLVAIHGKLGLLIGAAQMESARSIAPQFQWQKPVEIPQSRSRVLLIGQNGGEPQR